MISNPLCANRGPQAQAPGTAGGRPSAVAARTLRTCQYRSDAGRGCNVKVDGGRAQPHCSNHTCPHAGCMSPKSSKASHCAAHTAKGPGKKLQRGGRGGSATVVNSNGAVAVLDGAVGGRAGPRAFTPSSGPPARRVSIYDGFDAVDDSAA
jgi:hypothetical protein